MKQTKLKKYRVYYFSDIKLTGHFGGWIDLESTSKEKLKKDFSKMYPYYFINEIKEWR